MELALKRTNEGPVRNQELLLKKADLTGAQVSIDADRNDYPPKPIATDEVAKAIARKINR